MNKIIKLVICESLKIGTFSFALLFTIQLMIKFLDYWKVDSAFFQINISNVKVAFYGFIIGVCIKLILYLLEIPISVFKKKSKNAVI